jgi:hypothetical protein
MGKGSRNLAAINNERLERAQNAAVLRAAENINDVVDAITTEAKRGNVKAARLIFEVAGLVSRSGLNIAIQQNNTQPKPEQVLTVSDIVTISPEGEIVAKVEKPKGADE